MRLAPLLPPDPDPISRAAGYLADFEQYEGRAVQLDSARMYLERAGRAAHDPEVFPLWVQYGFWMRDYPFVARLAASVDPSSIGDAWTAYRIGESFLALGQPQRALPFLSRAVALKAEHPDFVAKQAGALLELGRLQEALAGYERALGLAPSQARCGIIGALPASWPGISRGLKRISAGRWPWTRIWNPRSGIWPRSCSTQTGTRKPGLWWSGTASAGAGIRTCAHSGSGYLGRGDHEVFHLAGALAGRGRVGLSI